MYRYQYMNIFHNFKIYSNKSLKINYESILKLFNTWFSLFFSFNRIPVLNFKIHIQVFKSSFQIRTPLNIHLFLFVRVQSSLLLFQRQFEMTQYIDCYIARLQCPVLNNINNHNFYQTLSDTELTIYTKYFAIRVSLLHLKLRHLVRYLRCMNLIAHTADPPKFSGCSTCT